MDVQTLERLCGLARLATDLAARALAQMLQKQTRLAREAARLRSDAVAERTARTGRELLLQAHWRAACLAAADRAAQAAQTLEPQLQAQRTVLAKLKGREEALQIMLDAAREEHLRARERREEAARMPQKAMRHAGRGLLSS